MDLIYSVFSSMLDMAWQATFVILIVILIRGVIGKASKSYAYILWIVVAVRLVCPIMISSEASIFNVVNTWEQGVYEYINDSGNDSRSDNMAIQQTTVDSTNKNDEIKTNSNDSQGSGTPILSNTNFETGDNKATSAVESKISSAVKSNVSSLSVIWLVGMIILIMYSAVSYLYLKYKIRFATRSFDNVYECEQIPAPFILGIVNPLIYVPYQMKKKELHYILEHEEYHIKRKDYLIKLVAFLVLCVYWFHPLVWLSFYLMCRDMEMSCDERVLAKADEEHKKEYSRIMLEFAVNKRSMVTVPIAFSESNTKKRIKRILNFKKPASWIGTIAIILLMLAIIVCLTDASDKKEATVIVEKTDTSETAATLFDNKNAYIGDNSSDMKLLKTIEEIYGGVGEYTIELQTSKEPYVLTLHFTTAPDEHVMWKEAVLVLALIDNCGEVHWDYPNNDSKVVYGVMEKDANDNLSIEDIKTYGQSAEKLQELLVILDREATGNKATPISESKELYNLSELDLTKTTGTEVIFDYADDNIVIFHGYFGLFVYDLQAESMRIMVNLLQTLGTNHTQGDDAVSVTVEEDGSHILLSKFRSSSDNSDMAFTIDTVSGEYTYSKNQPFDIPFSDFNEYGELDRLKYGYISADSDNIGSISYRSADGRLSYDVFSEYKTEETGETIEAVKEIEPINWYIDLTQDGKDERIVIDLTFALADPIPGEEQTVSIYSGSTDKLIWSGFADPAHVGWNGIYIYNDGKNDYLTIWKPTKYQGRAEYSIQVFSLTEDGQEHNLFAKGIEFNENNPYECDIEDISTYIENVNQYLEKSYVLLDTDGGVPVYSTEGNKITQTFELSEVLKSIEEQKQ